jgi:NADH-quinone oxidoreductase subunit J
MNLSELLTTERIAFFVFAVPLVFTAGLVVVTKNPMHAAMALVAAFFFMAGIYVLLSAHLVAFLQILVYAGAVMVLFLFVIMLLSLGNEHLEREHYKGMQLLGVVGMTIVLAMAIRDGVGPEVARVAPDFGTVKAVGRALFTDYLLPFEAISLLLLVAILGSVVVAKEKI